MTLGHIGIAVFIVGITLTSLYSSERDLRAEPGNSYELGGYQFSFRSMQQTEGKNFIAAKGVFDVSKDGVAVAVLQPEKREYRVQKMPMTEAAIDAGLTRDLFIALGEPLGDSGAWSVRIYHKPFIRWIWLGALIMAFGGLLSATDPRYRRIRRKAEKVQADSASAGAST